MHHFFISRQFNLLCNDHFQFYIPRVYWLHITITFFGGAAYASNSGSNSRISRHAHNFRPGFSCHIPLGDYHVTNRTQLVQNYLGCHNAKKAASDSSKGLVPRFQQEALNMTGVFRVWSKRLLEFEQPF